MLDVIRIDAECLGIDIGKNRRGAETVRLCDRGPVGDARADYFVAKSDIQGVHGAQDCRCAVIVSQTVFSTERFGVFFLELFGDFDAGHLPGSKHVEDGLFVPVCNDRPCKNV